MGGIVEERLPDALMGPTFACIIADQFKRLRDGDRFWFESFLTDSNTLFRYENDGIFNKMQLQQIKKASLARLFCDNGDNIGRVQVNLFKEIYFISVVIWLHVLFAGKSETSFFSEECVLLSGKFNTIVRKM